MPINSSGKVVIGLALLVPLYAQELKVGCEPKLATLRMLEALPSTRDYSIPFEARVGPLRALAEQYPNDFFVQRYYQDAFRRAWHLADEYDRALALYRNRPMHPLSRYFEARLLMNAEPSRSKKAFEELLAANPDFVWPHLEFIEWANLPGRRDPKEVESRLKRFMAACPDAVEAYENARLADDPDLMHTAAANLRRALERRNTPLDSASWANLWSLESRAGGDATALAQRVRADLKRIESRPFEPRLELIWVYRQGSELLKDRGIVRGFETKVAREAPQSLLLLWLIQQRWSKENEPPARDATPEQRKEYEAKKEVARREWAKRWPGNCGLVQEEWLQLSMRWYREANFVPGAGELTVADEMQRCRAQSPDVGMSVPPLETMLAEFYVKAKARLEKVPLLLDAGLKAMDRQEKYRISRDLIPAEMRRAGTDNATLTQERTQQVRAAYFIASGRTAEAHNLVQQQIAELDARRLQTDGPEPRRRLQYRRNEWVRLLAEIAEKESRTQEALELYRSTLEGVPREALGRSDNPNLASIKKLYLANGGTEEKWLEWAASGKTAEAIARPPLVFSQILPDFSAKDLSGRTWRLGNLKGKATFINYWATWCGPCRAEHPEVQKLHDQLTGRKDIQVLTISIDDTPAL
jgi:hypothetical protein